MMGSGGFELHCFAEALMFPGMLLWKGMEALMGRPRKCPQELRECSVRLVMESGFESPRRLYGR